MATVKVSEDNCNLLQFPKYMISGNGSVVYMTGPSDDHLCMTGVCIDVAGSTNYQGEYSENWDRAAFKDFKGTIQIEQ